MASGRVTSGSVAAFAGGAVAATVLTRILPPLLARAAGSAMNADAFEVLARDHKRFVALFDGMIEPETGTMIRAQRYLRLKRSLAAHALAEEDIVYPLLEENERVDYTRQLYAEHAQMKILLNALERLPKESQPWVEKARELRTLIESHARQEEDIEFPKLRERMGEQERAKLSGDVLREKAMIL